MSECTDSRAGFELQVRPCLRCIYRTAVIVICWALSCALSFTTVYECHGGVDQMGLKPNPLDLSSFSALTLLVGSFDP